MFTEKDISEIIQHFNIKGQLAGFDHIETGHINDSFIIEIQEKIANKKYFLQRINSTIFSKSKELMENIITVTQKAKSFYEDMPCYDSLHLFPTKMGTFDHQDDKGNHWRLYNYIQNGFNADIPESNQMAFEGGQAYGYFQKLLNSIPIEKIHIIIPRFHDLNFRFEQFDAALEVNHHNRSQEVKDEISFAKNRRVWGEIMQTLTDKEIIPFRVTHNDTKINNIIFNKTNLKAKSVVDLDTIMPGTILWDFGDMTRTFCSTTPEDEKDLDKIKINLNLFYSLSKGYLWEIKNDLSQGEMDYMFFGCKYISFIMGLRFLNDYLQGDIYYKTNFPDHNLIRCKAQFRLTEEFEKNEVHIKQLISRTLNLY